MKQRARTVRNHRRVFAVGLALSIVLHLAVLAFVRLHVPSLPAPENGSDAELAPDRYLHQRPLRVVRLERAPPPTPDADRPGSAAYPDRSATRRPAEADAVPAPRLTLSSAALDLRPVEATSGGLEAVALASTAASADGSSADLNDGVVFEAASRAAREAARDRGRERRGSRGAGIGITILGPGGGDCDPVLLPGGGPFPTVIVDDFTGRGGFGGDGRYGGAVPSGGRGGGLGGALPDGGSRLGGAGRP